MSFQSLDKLKLSHCKNDQTLRFSTLWSNEMYSSYHSALMRNLTGEMLEAAPHKP
jgi:hypothetical protein